MGLFDRQSKRAQRQEAMRLAQEIIGDWQPEEASILRIIAPRYLQGAPLSSKALGQQEFGPEVFADPLLSLAVLWVVSDRMGVKTSLLPAVDEGLKALAEYLAALRLGARPNAAPPRLSDIPQAPLIARLSVVLHRHLKIEADAREGCARAGLRSQALPRPGTPMDSFWLRVVEDLMAQEDYPCLRGLLACADEMARHKDAELRAILLDTRQW